MTPSRPYLLKAYFDWLLDNDLTPHLVVNAQVFGTEVPQEFVQNGQIVLNIEPSAVAAFHMDLTGISFSARFGGVPRNIYIPMAAVLAIYARETGAGSVFEPESAYDNMEQDPALDSLDKKPSSVSLGVVSTASTTEDIVSEKPADDGSTTTATKQKPTLRVIK